MIAGLFTLLAIPSMFVWPFAGWMTFAFFREGQGLYALRAGAVFAVTSVILIVAYQGAPGPTYSAGDCERDWDGFSNSEVC